MERFSDQSQADAHREFEEWRKQHPDGFVLNHRAVGEAMLHTAHCTHLTFGPNEKVSLTRQAKWCSESQRELLEAAMNKGIRVLRCQSCLG